MAEKVEIIEIDAGTATKTLKELKDEVKDLRRQLDDCEIGSDKFASTLDELTAAQTELKNATKSSNEALEGSYDALTAKMAELKKAWRATADEAERADLGQQIASINDQLKDMDASIGNYQRNVGNYASAFDDVTIKIEDGCMRFDRFNGAARSIIGSFDLVEGGLKAIGVESEEVNNLMDKMQGLMVITNGLASVKEGVQAFNTMRVAVQGTTVAQHGLNAAMKANPIGAIIAVVMAAVAAFTALVGWMNKAGDSSESLKEKNDQLTESFAKQNDELDYNLRLMKAKGASELQVLKAEYEGKLKIANDALNEYRKMHAEATDSKRWLGLANSISDDEQEQLDAAYKKYTDLHAEYKKAVDNYNLAVIQSNRERAEQEAADGEAAKQRARDVADAKIEAERRAIAEINKLYHEQAKERSEYWLNELQLKLLRAEEWAEEEKEVVRKQYANKLITEEEYLNQIYEIDRIFADKKRRIYEEAELASIEYFDDGTAAFVEAEQKKQDALDDTAAKVDKVSWKSMEMGDKLNAAAGLASTAFGQTAQVLNTLANAQDKNSKEGFENYKKLSYGAAVMSMLQGIISSWTSAMSLPAPISFITGGIMTAATATLGALQIDSIKRQSFNGSSGSTPSASTAMPNINTASLLSTPINYTSEVKGANAVEDATDTRVYVVESDITDTVNKVRVAEDESTF